MTFKKETSKGGLKTSKIVADSLINYSKYTKIHGVYYVFKTNSSHLRKGFWILVLLLMLFMTSKWSIKMYQGWEDQPVLTTLATTALPVKLVEFPAFTICGQGMNNDVLNSGMTLQLFKFLENKNITVNVSSYEAANLFYSKV
jgi:hypothetical protein